MSRFSDSDCDRFTAVVALFEKKSIVVYMRNDVGERSPKEDGESLSPDVKAKRNYLRISI
jgi:hypothetical protein